MSTNAVVTRTEDLAGATTETRWRALGTGVHVLVAEGDIEIARRAVTGVLADVDRAYGRFRPDSELVLLNVGESAPAWLAANALPARLVARDGRTVSVGGWPPALED